MPNWCWTQMEAHGTKENISRLHDFLNSDWTTLYPHPVENSFDSIGCAQEHKWLGHLEHILNKNMDVYDCKGYMYGIGDIHPYRDDAFILEFATESAYHRPYDVISALEERFDVKILFSEWEPNEGTHRTNDIQGIAFPARYVVEDERGLSDALLLTGDYTSKAVLLAELAKAGITWDGEILVETDEGDLYIKEVEVIEDGD